MSEMADYELRDGIGVITVNHPPSNTLSQPVRACLLNRLEQGLADAGARALLLTGGGRTFPSGADLEEVVDQPRSPTLEAVISAFEDSDKLIVAAIHGSALGGGLELALGCHYRVALSSAVFGLPEVKLGLIPGAGGTQRLPRLIGPKAALEMLVGGNPIKAARAQKLGMVDVVVDNNLLAGATLVVNRLAKHEAALHRVRELEAKPESTTQFEDFEQGLSSETNEFAAQISCLKAVRAAVEMPFEEGLKREHELLAELMRSAQTTARLQGLAAEGKGLADI